MAITKFLAAAVLAVPVLAKTIDTNYTATYEDTSGNGIGPVPMPGYLGLYYTNIVNGPFDYQSGDCAFVCPQSFPALVVSGQDRTATPGSVSTIYPKSNVTHIKLTSLYFGCASYINRTDPSSPGTVYNSYEPSNCTLTVLGYRNPKGSRLPAAQGITPDTSLKVQYRPTIGHNRNTGAPNAYMSQVVFGAEWANLKTVTFAVSGKVPPYNEQPLFYMDNLSYTATNTTS